MTYVSLYRKWRPQTFADVVGQTHVVRTLGNALAEKRIAHAYLFTGPRGTGKTTLARLLAKGLNCVNGPTAEPCGVCPSCERVAQGMAMDVVEIDGASNRGIDEMRDVRERVRFAPTEGAYKVYIIDEVHMLTTEAFNALLKVLEEPPAHVVFVFATTEPHKIPTTVTSRCQRFDFRRLSTADATGRLQHVAREEGIEVTPEALELIVRYADGSLRDGLGILDQARAYAERVTDEVVTDVLGVAPREQIEAFADVLAEADAARGLGLVKDLQAAGRDLRQYLRDVSRYLRDVLLYGAAGPDALRTVPGEEQLAAIAAHAHALPAATLLQAIDALAEAEGNMRLAARSHLPLEMAIIRLTAAKGAAAAPTPSARSAPTPSADVRELLDRINSLEATVAQLRSAVDALADVAPASQPASVPARAQVPASAPASAPAPARTSAPVSGPAPSRAPASAKASPASASVSGPDDALTAVRAQWNNLLEQLRREGLLPLRAFLLEGRPVAVIGETLTVEFPKDRGFHRANVAAPDNTKKIEQILRGLLGRNVRLETVMVGEFVPPVGSAQTSAPTPGRAPDPASGQASPLGADPGQAPGPGSGPASGPGAEPATGGASEPAPGGGPGRARAASSAARPRAEAESPAPRGQAAPGDATRSKAAGSPSQTTGEAPAIDPDVLAAAAQDPLVRDALNLFGGKIVGVEPSAKPHPDENSD